MDSFATFVGKQRKEEYVEKTRIPTQDVKVKLA